MVGFDVRVWEGFVAWVQVWFTDSWIWIELSLEWQFRSAERSKSGWFWGVVLYWYDWNALCIAVIKKDSCFLQTSWNPDSRVIINISAWQKPCISIFKRLFCFKVNVIVYKWMTCIVTTTPLAPQLHSIHNYIFGKVVLNLDMQGFHPTVTIFTCLTHTHTHSLLRDMKTQQLRLRSTPCTFELTIVFSYIFFSMRFIFLLFVNKEKHLIDSGTVTVLFVALF